MHTSTFLRIAAFILPLFFFACKSSKDDPSPLASIRVDSVGAIKAGSAKVYCTILSEGSSAVASAGVAWSTKPNPTTFDNLSPATGFGVGSFTVEIKGLTQGTAYNVRAYATNLAGTAYSEQKSFASRLKNIPVVTTGPITNLQELSAVVGGTIVDSSFSTKFEHGICWSTKVNPSLSDTAVPGLVGFTAIQGTSLGAYTIPVSDLKAGKTYHVRAFATNSVGTGYGEDLTFSTTPLVLPTLVTNPAVRTNYYMVTIPCVLSNRGNVSGIEYLGVCYSESHNPTYDMEANSDLYSNQISFEIDLYVTTNKTYYARAFAITSDGVSYGNEIEFSTPLGQAGAGVTDIDGNVYPTVKIGNQEWMAQNLRATRFNGGTAITLNPNDALWSAWSGSPTYASAFLNDNSNIPANGLLYNNFVAQHPSLNVCPVGWHIPSKSDVLKMVNFLDGAYSANAMLKSTTGWLGGVGPGNNASGFSATASGRRNADGSFENWKYGGYWWSDTPGWNWSWYSHVNISQVGFVDYNDSRMGYSIRCLKD